MAHPSPRRFTAAAIAVTLVALGVYASLRVQHVGGSDSYGYYSLSLLFDQGRLTLPVGLDPERFPAVAPLGYVANGSDVLPTYSPGLPALISLARPFGLEFFVTPVLGALSILLIYALSLQVARPGIALGFAGLWAVSPIVVWASTNLMSDGVAAFFACLALWLYGKRRFGWLGTVIGLSLAVRPANVLMFAVVAAAICLRPRDLVRFGACFAIGVLPIALYNTVQFGSPATTGYGDAASGFGRSVFVHHFSYYVSQTIVVLTPGVLFAFVPVVMGFRRHVFHLAWCLAFLLFYSFYWPGADAWWYTRFLLPAYPALMVLMAAGTEQTYASARLWGSKRTVALGSMLLAGMAFAMLVNFGNEHGLFRTGREAAQAIDSRSIRDSVAPDALVGAIDFSGSLRLYGGLETFRWDQEGAIDVVEYGLEAGRPVYVVVEPWHWEHGRLLTLLERFALEESLALSTWHDTFLWRVTPRPL